MYRLDWRRGLPYALVVASLLPAQTAFAQTVREPAVYRLPDTWIAGLPTGASAGTCANRPVGRNPVPSLYYHGRFGHYYWNAVNAAMPNRPDPKFRVRIFAPVDPVANGYGVVVFASGGFISHPDAVGCEEYEQEEFYLKLSRELLESGYTVFVVTHGDALLQDAEETYPGWIVSEIMTHAHHGVRAIKAALGVFTPSAVCGAITNPSTNPNYVAGLPGFPSGLAAQLATNAARFGAIGSSSGGGLALEVYGRPAVGETYFSFADANMPAAPDGLAVCGIDSACYAASVSSTGPGGIDWRFPGDTAFLWTIPRYLFHADLSQCNEVNSALAMQGLPAVPAPPAQFGVNLGDLFVDQCATPQFPEHPFNDSYDPFPGTSKLLLQQLSLYETWTTTPSGTPWTRGRFRHAHGTDDLLVPFYQQSLLAGAAQARGVIGEFAQRSGEGHFWKDLDGEDAQQAVRFLDAELRTIADADGDGALDATETASNQPGLTDRFDADTDGDGQSDGDEAAVGTNPLDPRSLFRVYDVTQTRTGSALPSCLSTTVGGDPSGTYETFFVTLRFEAPSTTPTPGAFVLQWTADLAPGSRTTWTDYGASCGSFPVDSNYSGALTGYEIKCRVRVGENRRLNCLRVRFVPSAPLVGRPDIATEPVAQRLVEVHRDAASGNRRWNFVAPPIVPRDEVRGDVASVGYSGGMGTITFQSFTGALGAAEDVASPGNPAPFGADGSGAARFVAVVVRDRGRDPLTVKPENRGAEGRWWEIDGVVDVNTIRVKPHGSNTTTFLDGLQNGAEVAIRRLSSLADLVGPSSDVIRNACFETPLASPQNDDRVMRFDRTNLGGVATRYRYRNVNNVRYWERDAATLSDGCPSGDPAASWVGVNVEDVRLLPDEAFGYWSKGHALGVSWFASVGWLTNSDLVAYLEPETGGGPWPAPFAPACQLVQRRVRSWPFAEDVPLGNLRNSSTAPDSNLVASGFVLGATDLYDTSLDASSDAIYVADIEAFAAENAKFAATNALLAGAGYTTLTYPSYSGDAGGVAVAGRIDAATLSATPELMPLRQTWFVDLSTTVGGGANMLFFWDPFGLPGLPHAAIMGHEPNGNVHEIDKAGSDVVGELPLRAGRGYQLRLGDAHADVFEWLRRRPYRRQ